ncbi:HemK2/MTQ2 family protein methyltransferase [Geoglobus acetivorans]|uniref:Methyltransferase n=1 Tax=Geoglobus acetivorans TaxID=565033 RepID=A0ABZ3H722_GEOAI|nr:methyltransferase [Geoglobus acetivorans]
MRGLKEFHRKFLQNCQNVYEPAEDSDLLLEAALVEINEDDVVLEVGGGSGYVSYFLKDRCRYLLSTDINPYAVKCMKKMGIECIRTYLARGIRTRFSLILFNPPYLELEEWEKKEDWLEKAIDGGKNGTEITEKFLEEIKHNLLDNGRIIIISSSHTHATLEKYLEKSEYVWKIIKRKKLFFEELYALKLKLR